MRLRFLKAIFIAKGKGKILFISCNVSLHEIHLTTVDFPKQKQREAGSVS